MLVRFFEVGRYSESWGEDMKMKKDGEIIGRGGFWCYFREFGFRRRGGVIERIEVGVFYKWLVIWIEFLGGKSRGGIWRGGKLFG